MDIFFDLRLIVLVVAVGVNTFLALIVILNNPKSATNRIYALLSVVISLWLSVNFISIHPAFLSGSLIWIRLSLFFAVPLSVLFYLLANTIPKNNFQMSRMHLLIIILINFLVMFLTLSPFVFSGVEILNGVPVPIVEPGMGIFGSVSTYFSVMAVVVLVRKLRSSRGFEKEQYLYVMLGILVMLGLIITTVLLPVVLFKVSTFVSFIPLYTLIFLAATTYAIVKHRLLDLRLFVARTIAYSFLITLSGVFYAIAVFLAGLFFFPGSSQSVGQFGLYVFLALFIAATFESFRHYLEKLTGRLFFKNAYIPQQVLATMSKIMASTLELDNLANLLLQEIRSSLKTSRSSIILTRENKIIWKIEDGNFHYQNNHLEVDRLLPSFLHYFKASSSEEILIFDEIEESEEKKQLRNYSISVSVLLKVKDRAIGFLILGEKSSGEIYSSQDIEMLKILAPEIAVAINNSLSYEEIKRFNFTLKEGIEKATKDLQDANERLTQLDHLKDEFVSLASHELRTPMTVIKSYLWFLLEGKKGELTSDQKKYIENAYFSTERLIDLVNDMLNVSRIEAGRLTISPQVVDLIEVTDRVIAGFRPRGDELHLNLIFEKPNEAMPKVMADPERIEQVLINLIGNAIKFTPEGGSVSVKLEHTDGNIVTKVIDTGRGIKEEDVPKLFKKFGMAGDSNFLTRQATTQGSGLGLYICKSLVELMKGGINVRSEGEGKGSTFSFWLPVVIDNSISQINTTDEPLNQDSVSQFQPAVQG